MEYQELEPIDPRDAFTVMPSADVESTQAAAASQSALLLSARAGVLGVDDEAELWKEDAADSDFAIPDLEALRRTRRLRVDEATEPLGVSARELEQQDAPDLQDEMVRTVNHLYERPSVEGAAALFEAAMYSPHPLVRVSAAAGARETTRLRKRIRYTLETGAESEGPLVARLAQTALAKIDPGDPHVQKRVIPQPDSKKHHRESSTAVVTHGTFAADADWYQPGGGFYEALAVNRPDLKPHDESFRWTGAYSDAARRADALLLKQWIDDQGLDEPDFFAHSHGGTVAHHATKRKARFNRLVLMGWPVHERWFPKFRNVQRIIDVRVRLDLVIILDRGGQRFRTDDFDIEEHRHGWFDHTSTREPEYWDEHDLWKVL
ncbi:MAG: hypothetical protein U9N79_02025 [Actinomycetota bacterium]|nr:hypothetical protein [Actinomycetota bacterium]